ncbi:MAG: hypothetical protein JWR70_3202 [Modestobacter sp.]|jgi:hypothetical protein|nr:hypothetical protein [Modestobacter sp.]
MTKPRFNGALWTTGPAVDDGPRNDRPAGTTHRMAAGHIAVAICR